MKLQKSNVPYRFGPFRLDSEIDLADLRLHPGQAGLPVTVRLGPVDFDRLDGSRLSALVSAAPEVCVLDVPGLAKFAVLGGCRVVVDLEPGANLGDVRGYLTAWVFGALCHQNGMLPLHASAVARDGSATAFLGDSGAGKSTLAAFLGQRGYIVSSDDICLLRDTPERILLEPVAEWLKLWRGSLEALGEPVVQRDRTYSDEDKYRLYRAEATPREQDNQPVPVLANLVFVERGEGPAALEKLSNAATLGRMMETVYLGYCMRAMGIEGRAFAQCGRVMQRAQGWVLRAPWGFAEMPAVLDLLEAKVLAPLTAARVPEGRLLDENQIAGSKILK